MRCLPKEEGTEAASANLNFVITTIDGDTVDKAHTELSNAFMSIKTTEKEKFDLTSFMSGG